MEIIFYILTVFLVTNHAYQAGRCAENGNTCIRKIKKVDCIADKTNKCTRLGKKND